MNRNNELFKGCLLGGAVGDALGYPVEFMTREEIRQQYGGGGIQDLVVSHNGCALISDDTQMTLFTAEGILRAEATAAHEGDRNLTAIVYESYLRWKQTQTRRLASRADSTGGWLLTIPGLYARRSPGNTCMSALESKVMGTRTSPINDSKGCGGVMRVAPVGLFFPQKDAFSLGADLAAITHGHPSGYLSAGALAHLIAGLKAGISLVEAVDSAREMLSTFSGHQECSEKLDLAVDLAQRSVEAEEAIPLIGAGWVGEEALAISVYCALSAPTSFRQAVVTAVNHSGDSDSTGAITGNIMGAWLGGNQIPAEWVQHIELREVLMQMAGDLITGYEDTPDWHIRYPQ